MADKWGNLRSIRDLSLVYDSSLPPLPGKIVPCLMCIKPFLMRRYSGMPDQICPECFTTYMDCARIVCVRCKVVIARVKPEVLESGFYIKPRAILHADACNVCSPGIQASTVIEIGQYERSVGRTRSTVVPIRIPWKGK
jgi:hypothetical protein